MRPEGVAGTKFAFNAVHVVFEDHNATILRAVHDKPISRVKPYSVSVSRKLIHQIGSPPNRQRPTRKVVTEIEKRILRNRVEKCLPSTSPVSPSWIVSKKGFKASKIAYLSFFI